MANCFCKYYADGTVIAKVTSFEVNHNTQRARLRTLEKKKREQKEYLALTGSLSLTDALDRENRSITSSMHRSRETVFDLARNNVEKFSFFTTFTFDPKKINSFSYDAVSKRMTNFFCCMHRKYPDLSYILVFELHRSGRYHAHALLGGLPESEFVDSGHVKAGEPIYNIPSFTAGFTTASRIRSPERTARYITKYLTKDMCAVSKGKKRYFASRNLAKPRTDRFTVTGIEHQLFDVFGAPVFQKDIEINKKDFKGVVKLFEFSSIRDMAED